MRTVLRSMEPEDKAFLYEVYASTREEELAVLPWSSEEKERFLRMQFEAQHGFYMNQFPDAEFSIIELEGKPIGRYYLEHRHDEYRIIDIALLPPYRNQGIGGEYLKALCEKAMQSGLPICIHVEQNNRAMALYKRVGFKKIGDTGVYNLMEWRSNAVRFQSSVNP